MSVVQFKPRETPNMQGSAYCMGCKHTWQAVAPVGTTDLQCPECQSMKGRFVNGCAPEDHIEVRECNCGNQLFWLTREGHMCANCGTYQEYE